MHTLSNLLTLNEDVAFTDIQAERPLCGHTIAGVHPHAEAGHHEVTDGQIQDQHVRRRPHPMSNRSLLVYIVIQVVKRVSLTNQI